MTDDGPEWPPPSLDVNKPTVARAYDALLGGKDNFAADRAVADTMRQRIPGIEEFVAENRAALVRGVRWLAGEAGIDQFLDLGSGLPTQQNTHEVAQAENPAARVVYIDIDPLVLVHGRALLAGNDNTKVIAADVREPATILDHPEVTSFLDFDRPVALMLIAMLHFLSPETSEDILAAYRDALAPGSYLFLTCLVDTGVPAQQDLAGIMRKSFDEGGWARTPSEIERHIGEFELLDPGITYIRLWRSENPVDAADLTSNQQMGVALIARKKG